VSAPRRPTIAFRSHAVRGPGGEPTPREYEILETAGEGAMGVVYAARHVALDRVVALKVIGASLSGDPEAMRRFLQEARASSLLRHVNTVQVLDFGGDADGAFLVMEYLHGADLADVMDAEGPLAPARAVAIAAQALAGLAAAHDLGIVHRDIKPSNLKLVPATDDDGAATELVKVLDFGIATMERGISAARVGEIIGTPDYMSPEQAKGHDVDARSDVYAVGVLLYGMLAGDVPFAYDSPMETLIAHLREAPRPLRERAPGVSEELAAVVMQALEKDPARRPESARAFRAALLGTPEGGGRAPVAELAATSEPVASSVPVAPIVAAATPRVRSKVGPWVALALGAVAVTVGAVELSGVGFARTTEAAAPGVAAAEGIRPLEVARAPRIVVAPSVPAGRLVTRAAPTPWRATRVPAVQVVEADPPATGDEVARAPVREAKPREPRKVTTPEAHPTPPPAAVAAVITPGPAPSAPPAPAPIAASVASPAPAPAPAPTPAIAPTFSARAVVSGLTLDGALSRSALARAIEAQRPTLEACYADASRAAHRDAAVGATVQLEIDVDGRARVLAVGALGLPGLGACAGSALGRMRLKDRPDTGTVLASFHLAFAPRAP